LRVSPVTANSPSRHVATSTVGLVTATPSVELNLPKMLNKGNKDGKDPLENVACATSPQFGLDLGEGASGRDWGFKKKRTRKLSGNRVADGTPRFIWLPRMLERQ
jgi:hypothetical protein